MINLADCNMYEVNAAKILETYEQVVDGTGKEIVLVISEHELSQKAIDALEKSAISLGFGVGHGMQSCARVVAATLDASVLYHIVEGLDPLVVVATDAFSANLMSTAYHIRLENDTASRALGRTVVVFRDFEALLDTPEKKQRAWALLKKLNHP